MSQTHLLRWRHPVYSPFHLWFLTFYFDQKNLKRWSSAAARELQTAVRLRLPGPQRAWRMRSWCVTVMLKKSLKSFFFFFCKNVINLRQTGHVYRDIWSLLLSWAHLTSGQQEGPETSRGHLRHKRDKKSNRRRFILISFILYWKETRDKKILL